MSKYSKQQWLTLIIFGIADFCSAVCVSLQAPFYPSLAESKGATATQYGLVFGIFELVVFLVSPLYGQYINQIGPKFMFNAGIFTTGSTCILFGLLDKIDDSATFIGLSFGIRIIEALGNAGFLTASFSIIAKEFPDNVGATFASLETCFGLGLIVGPTVGGALYEAGGYTLPFATLGTLLLLAACITVVVLPSYNVSKEDSAGGHGGGGSLLVALKVPPIAMAAFGIVAASISIGFLQATLEPHLRPLELSPLEMGLMFVLNGGMYALSAPCWGYICDKKKSPHLVTLLGSLIVVIAFLLVGPAPFFYMEITMAQTVISLILHGLGFGGVLVSTFSSAHSEALANGFPDDLSTYGMVSGLWTSTFALGAFIGPTIAGSLMDAIGFAWGTMFVVALHVICAVVVSGYLCRHRRRYGGIYESLHPELALGKEEKIALKSSMVVQDFDSSISSSKCSSYHTTSEEYAY